MTIVLTLLSTAALAGAVLAWIAHSSSRRVGGLTFWRVGAFGGSFYVSKKVV